jgi:LmbE family N-acetylglucosaminyl deacetylase
LSKKARKNKYLVLRRLTLNNEAIHALVISPHPSDPDFGIGGTALRWAREGKNVIYVICTNGDKGTTDPELLPDELAKIREQEQLKAAGMLGVKNVIFLRHPDLGLQDTPELKKEILKLILTYRPVVVATCNPFSQGNQKYISNPDHRVLGRLVLDVVWPTCLAPNNYRDLLKQGLKPHKVQELLIWGTGEPNYYVDITPTYDIKMSACYCHQSQIGPQGNQDFIKMLPESFKTAGKVIGVPYAESFYRIEVLQKL